MFICFLLFRYPRINYLDSDANEEIDGAITGDVADSAGSIEMTSKAEREMTSSFSMQRATDALLDYVTEN